MGGQRLISLFGLLIALLIQPIGGNPFCRLLRCHLYIANPNPLCVTMCRSRPIPWDLRSFPLPGVIKPWPLWPGGFNKPWPINYDDEGDKDHFSIPTPEVIPDYEMYRIKIPSRKNCRFTCPPPKDNMA